MYCQSRVRPENALRNHSCCNFPEPAVVWFNISGPSKIEKAVIILEVLLCRIHKTQLGHHQSLWTKTNGLHVARKNKRNSIIMVIKQNVKHIIASYLISVSYLIWTNKGDNIVQMDQGMLVTALPLSLKNMKRVLVHDDLSREADYLPVYLWAPPNFKG